MAGEAPKTLNVNETPQVQYCIPLWLRDEQVKLATARVSQRLQPRFPSSEQTTDEPIAVVCFGPSLNETWEQVRGFHWVITCSGAHKFLLDRGLVPTWHVEVDPRAHKVQLIGPPHRDVEYLIASTCHPAVFDHLDGYTVKLWHVFSDEAEAFRVLPPGEWALTGGSSVGLRALTLARFLGFRNLHVFGMDGCEGGTGKHAAAHPNQAPGYALCEYEGVTYRTTGAMLACAKQTWHELDQLKDCKATFYGDGLVQAMAKRYTPNTPMGEVFLGVNKPELISPAFRALNAQLHRENLAYGVGGERHASIVLKLADGLKTKNILDYGCGKGRLGKAIPWAIAEYDPAIPGKEEPPKPADLVVCTDVLEHVEPDTLLYVLDDLRRCVKQVGYFTIHTGPAKKCYADGRNTHLIQRDRHWWGTKLAKFFTVGKILQAGPELHIVVGPKPAPKKAPGAP